MTPDRKRAGVERLRPSFHRIELGDGVVTKGATDRFSSGGTTRAHLLHELLWCDELRRG